MEQVFCCRPEAKKEADTYNSVYSYDYLEPRALEPSKQPAETVYHEISDNQVSVCLELSDIIQMWS